MEQQRNTQTPIIVGGFYRSGTSLFRRLLDSHSQIHCPAEIKLFSDIRGDYMNDPLAHGRFFQTLSKAMQLDKSTIVEIFGNTYVNIRQNHLTKINKSRWADKNPDNVLYLEDWQRVLGSNFVFIYIVRNPLDAYASLKEIGFKKTLPPQLKKRVAIYQKFCATADAFIQQRPENSLLIRYEDLTSNPKDTLEKVCAKNNEGFEPSMLTNFNSEARINGIEDPKVKNTKNISEKNHSRWKKDLSGREVRWIRKQLMPTFLNYGYTEDDFSKKVKP